MTKDGRLSWNKPDVSLRRVHFLLTDRMKFQAKRTLSEAADVIRNLRNEIR
jgi:hypothetical protein